MTLRSVEDRDLPAIAAIHKAQFSTHFLGQYSIRLLTEFYRSFMGKTVFILHETGNEVDGFVLGGPLSELHGCKAAFLLNNRLRCVWETVLRPRLWLDAPRRALGNMAGGRTDCAPPEELPNESRAEILSIAVAKKAMGRGVATELVDAFVEAVKDDATVCGLSVAKDNARAIRFYEKIGFEIQGECGSSLVLRKRLRPASQPSP